MLRPCKNPLDFSFVTVKLVMVFHIAADIYMSLNTET